MQVTKLKFPIVLILIASIVGVFLYFSNIYFFERKERDLCREFLVRNEKVIKLIGQIKQIEPSLKGSFVEGYGDEVSGRYSFIISGTLKKKTFFIDWQINHGEFVVKRIYVTEENSNKNQLIEI